LPYRWSDIPTPSEQLVELLSGKTAWEDAPASIRSWAGLEIYRAACAILAEPEKGNRRNMLGRIPRSIRPHVEAEARRVFILRRSPH
jgi:hypothetical protein